jgi:flagellum-specific peptidoglycan hydrolase FlgJ
MAFPASSDQAARLAQMQRLLGQAAGSTARAGNLPASGLPQIGGGQSGLKAYTGLGDAFQAPQVRRSAAPPPGQPAPLPAMPQEQTPTDGSDVQQGADALKKTYAPKEDDGVAAALARAEAAIRSGGLRQPLDLSDLEPRSAKSKVAMTPTAGPDTGEADPNAPDAPPAPSAKAYIEQMKPHALRVAKATGVDPKLVIAQAALETGWGQHAPGNNHFGIKGGNGPALTTQEAGPDGKLYTTKARFRGYKDAGESADDYGRFLKENDRYAPVLKAKGLDAQIDAMAGTGYATDPHYGLKLHSIASQIPDLEEPTS